MWKLCGTKGSSKDARSTSENLNNSKICYFKWLDWISDKTDISLLGESTGDQRDLLEMLAHLKDNFSTVLTDSARACVCVWGGVGTGQG